MTLPPRPDPRRRENPSVSNASRPMQVTRRFHRSTPVHGFVQIGESLDEPAPSQMLLGVPASGLCQSGSAQGIPQKAHDTGCQRDALRRDQDRPLMVQDGSMSWNVGGDDGASRGEVIKDLERQVSTVGAW